MSWYYPEANGALLLALGNEGILSFARNLYGRHQEIMDLELEAPYTVQFSQSTFYNADQCDINDISCYIKTL